ncbi:ATP synthase regulation protein NCA2-domain-containing protein [Radiomyces spectabilis]|uniref:ATP synthase regulation protein NCA2-domain-containing protein n=1 Tax=Radiomyces spectabilis TaxID=64574 RepID=UPI00221F0531|nr:ATP synthase regulation protein NCA2-domain-containing protein [Radiomyces spectabilis]KAI8365316.1 ATP synthase regulation protein NCA2-domain-containing protein [Radiomyces spectabilis]
MTTYISEQVNRLNASLSDIFQNEPSLEAASVSHTETNSVKTAYEQGDKTRFLSLASQAIDLSTTNLPSIKTVQEYLNLYTSFTTTADPALEWLFVSKCTIAIYGFLFSKILNSTLPITEAMTYWDSIYGNVLKELYYGLQTAPTRIATLAVSTLHMVRKEQRTFKAVMTSSDHILSNIFPVRGRMLANRYRPRQLFSKLSYRPLFVHMIHEEIGEKKKALQKFRAQQATRLGLLLDAAPRFSDASAESEHDPSFPVSVAHDTSRCVELMQQLLKPLNRNNDAQACIEVGDMEIDQAIGSLESSMIEQSYDAAAIAQTLQQIINDWDTCQKNLDAVHRLYGQLSRFERYWIPTLTLYFTGNALIRYVSNRKYEITAWGQELAATAHDFVIHWIWDPLVEVWDTIRLKDQRLSLLSKDGLRSDLESLQRMVVQFAHDRYHLSESDMAALVTQIRDGDMSLVLKAYENEIKHPLKNAIKGDLIQALLIQIQKTKVDIDLAMAALDKLLKSNELNFAFLAVAPSMLLTWASCAWIRNVYQSRGGRRVKQIGQPIREAMR